MPLSKVEKERVNDSRLKLQSVSNSLKKVDPKEIPEFEEIEECLEDAERSLDKALRPPGSDKPEK